MKYIFKEYKKLKSENKILQDKNKTLELINSSCSDKINYLREENYKLKKENILVKEKNKIIKKIESRLNYELGNELCNLTKETVDLLKFYINM